MKATKQRTIIRLGTIQGILVSTVSAVLLVSLPGIEARAAEQEKGAAKLVEKKVEAKKETRVQITGSLIPQKVKRAGSIADTAFPVAIIDRAQIERTGAASLKQVLQRHPGGH